MIRPLVMIVTGVLFTATLGRAADLEPVRPGQGTFISRIAFAGHKLWLLTDAGTLSSIAEGGNERVAVFIPEPAFDLWIQDGAPAVLTGERTGGKFWTVRRWDRDSWIVLAQVPTNGEPFVAVGTSKNAVTLLTSRRLIDIVGGETHVLTVTWAEKQMLAGITSTLVTTDSVFLGFNISEWGGGLRRVDRKTGTISVIDSRTSSGLCSGPLNTDCDPVNGIVKEPGKAGCVAAAIGLVHVFSHGRVVEVCGKAVRRLYFTPAEGASPRDAKDINDEPVSSVAFFGLSAVDNELWAVGSNGLHQIRADGSSTVTPLPTFRRIGDVSVSFVLPRVVLVLTDVNQRRSLSGSVPLMVTR